MNFKCHWIPSKIGYCCFIFDWRNCHHSLLRIVKLECNIFDFIFLTRKEVLDFHDILAWTIRPKNSLWTNFSWCLFLNESEFIVGRCIIYLVYSISFCSFRSKFLGIDYFGISVCINYNRIKWLFVFRLPELGERIGQISTIKKVGSYPYKCKKFHMLMLWGKILSPTRSND